MSWYKTGTIAATNGSKIITGTGTQFTNSLNGVSAGRMLLLPAAGTVQIYEIESVQSDIQLTLVSAYTGTTGTGKAYAIPTSPTVSIEQFAHEFASTLAYYQQQLSGWQQILTGTGNVTLTTPDGQTVTVRSQKAWDDVLNGKVNIGDYGIGGSGVQIPDGSDALDYLYGKPSGFYKAGGTVTNTPVTGVGWGFFVTRYDATRSGIIAVQLSGSGTRMETGYFGGSRASFVGWTSMWTASNLPLPLSIANGGSGKSYGAFANGPNASSATTLAAFLSSVETYGNNSAGSASISDDGATWHTYLSVKHRSGEGDGVNYGFMLVDRDMTGNHYNQVGLRKRTPAGWRGFVNLWHSENLIKQSSLTDTTSGAVMIFGSFGLGAGQTSYTLGNMNDATRNGFASYVANIQGAPTANPGYALLFGFDSNSRGQIAADAGSDELRFRATSGAVWKPWTRLINDVSVQNITGKKTFSGGLEDGVTQIGKRALSAREVLVSGNVSKLDTCVQGQVFLVESQNGGSNGAFLPNTQSANPADSYSYTCISRHDTNNSIGLFLVTNLTSTKAWLMRHIVSGTRSFEWQEIILGGTSQDITGSKRFTSNVSIAAQGMEIGRMDAAAQAFVDFHSSGNNLDYDARIISTSGGTGNGGASLNLIATVLQWSGSAILANGKNAVADANGFWKTASPVVKLFADGTSELTSEAEGITTERVSEGVYRISGCLGLNADRAWGGDEGGIDVPMCRNKLPRLWVDYGGDEGSEKINPDGSIVIRTYHRPHPEAPGFARNEIEGYANGDPIDIPHDTFISVRVQMPETEVQATVVETVPDEVTNEVVLDTSAQA